MPCYVADTKNCWYCNKFITEQDTPCDRTSNVYVVQSDNQLLCPKTRTLCPKTTKLATNRTPGVFWNRSETVTQKWISLARSFGSYKSSYKLHPVDDFFFANLDLIFLFVERGDCYARVVCMVGSWPIWSESEWAGKRRNYSVGEPNLWLRCRRCIAIILPGQRRPPSRVRTNTAFGLHPFRV